jgi:hypothetical protein
MKSLSLMFFFAAISGASAAQTGVSCRAVCVALEPVLGTVEWVYRVDVKAKDRNEAYGSLFQKCEKAASNENQWVLELYRSVQIKKSAQYSQGTVKTESILNQDITRLYYSRYVTSSSRTTTQSSESHQSSLELKWIPIEKAADLRCEELPNYEPDTREMYEGDLPVRG